MTKTTLFKDTQWPSGKGSFKTSRYIYIYIYIYFFFVNWHIVQSVAKPIGRTNFVRVKKNSKCLEI